MDFETRRRLYNRCDPSEALDPGDDRNLDIDSFPEKIRGANWVDRLAKRIEFSDKPICALFTGLPGSGKSTELRRLMARLKSDQGRRMLPVYVDAYDLVDLANPVDIPEILSAILFRCEEEVLKLEGKDPEGAMADGFLVRLWTWLHQTDVELGKGEFAIPSGPKLVFELKTRESLRQRVRKTVATHLTRFLADLRDDLRLLDSRVQAKGFPGGIVVLFDSLEKLRGISSNWHQVLESAENLFRAGAPYLALPVPVLYTVPVALLARRTVNAEFMPMIKLRNRDGSDCSAGFRIAREVVRRRIPDENLTELLGPNCELRIEQLIRWSGGYLREIVRLVQDALLIDHLPLLDDDLGRIISSIQDSYHFFITADAYEWLARVARSKDLVFLNDDHRMTADLMLQNHAVLRYLNQDSWFDLHPAVARIPGVREAERRLLEVEKSLKAGT